MKPFIAFLSFLSIASTAPAGHVRKHLHEHHKKDIDWATVNYNIDWATVKYNVDWATVNYNQAAATTQAAAVTTAQAIVGTPQAVATSIQAVVGTPIGKDDSVLVVTTSTTPSTSSSSTFTTSTSTTSTSSSSSVSTPSFTSVVEAAAKNIAIVTTKSSTSSALPAATSASTSSSSKRGLCWPYTNNISWAKMYSKMSWYYNWSPTPTAGMSGEFFANIWGSGGIANLASTITGKPKLIGFNEPDNVGQSNLGVTQAISLYKQYLVPLKTQGIISQLGSPAVTNSGGTNAGLGWLKQFVAGCTGCGLDFVVVHWYNNNIDDFINHVTQAHTDNGLPVVVAEFAFTDWTLAGEPTEVEVEDFLKLAMAWLDAQSFVTYYSYFGPFYVSESEYPTLGSANSLANSGGTSLTTLGNMYVS